MPCKTHEKIFLGFLGLFSPIPSSVSIIKHEILPSVKGIIESLSFGRFLYFILLVSISISSIAWINEILNNIEKTSRFMGENEWNNFLAKNVAFAIFGILAGLIIGKFFI